MVGNVIIRILFVMDYWDKIRSVIYYDVLWGYRIIFVYKRFRWSIFLSMGKGCCKL